MSRLGNRAVTVAAALHVVAVDTRRASSNDTALPRLLLAVVVYVFEVKCVDVTGDVTQECQADVDEEVYGTGQRYLQLATALQETWTLDNLPMPQPATA